jgi:transglutaminase-like putative cysteine protease
VRWLGAEAIDFFEGAFLGNPSMKSFIATITFAYVLASVASAQQSSDSTGNSRSFSFIYSGAVTELPTSKSAKVWLPLPTTTSEQDIIVQKTDLPGKAVDTKDRLYGNGIVFFEAQANEKGEIPFHMEFKVVRREVKTGRKGHVARKPTESAELIARYLRADTKVPIEGKPLDLIKDKQLPSDPFESAKILYDVVNGHMKYSKEGTGWGQGDAVWACDSKFGNCSDFHSLFISMARGRKIPSKFEMGFSIPVKRGEGSVGGYHCWAWFLAPGKGWVPVDISEANRNPDMVEYYFGNLTEDRVHFTAGRDLQLEPRQAGPALNFFIYPYVEVDGQPYSAEKVRQTITYKDIP